MIGRERDIKEDYTHPELEWVGDSKLIFITAHRRENLATFGEVLHSANISYSQNRTNTPDNRLMIYFQGMKLYIPDNFQPDTLTKALLNDNRIDDLKRALEDPAFRQKLLEGCF